VRAQFDLRNRIESKFYLAQNAHEAITQINMIVSHEAFHIALIINFLGIDKTRQICKKVSSEFSLIKHKVKILKSRILGFDRYLDCCFDTKN